MHSICLLESARMLRGKSTLERRFYISTLPAQAPLMLNVTRSHWAIEKPVHWTLEMTFREEQSRLRGLGMPLVATTS